jgi:hypothetical protein
LAFVPQKSPPSRARRAVLFGILAFAYVYVFPYQDRTNNPNENVRFFMTAAIVDDHTFAIDHVREQWGWVNDAAIYGGHAYSVKAPGTSYLGVPAYWLYRTWCNRTGHSFDRSTALWATRFGGSILPTLWFLYAFHRWLARKGGPPVVRDAIVLSLGVGSLLYAYGMLFVSHTLSAATAFGAFMILEKARRDGEITGMRAIHAGFLAAAVTAFEYPGFIATAILCVYALVAIRRRAFLVNFALGALVPTLSVLGFHLAAFGNAFTPGHRYLESEAFRAGMNDGFYGSGQWRWEACGGLLFDLGYGLFPLTPILLLAFIGFPILLRDKRTRIDAAFALAIPLMTCLLVFTLNNWRGGWTVGPRYLAVAYPFLGWAALEGGRALSKLSPRATGGFAVACLSVGLLASGAPSIYYPHLPEAITRPLPQLLRILVRYDFAPYNAGSYLADTFGGDFHGSLSMLPMALLGLLALLFVSWGEKKTQDRIVVFLLSLLFGSWLLTPLITNDENAASAAQATAGLLGYWDPAGFDRAARIEARMRAGTATDADYDRLPLIYAGEGRTFDQQMAEQRRDQHRSPIATGPQGFTPLPNLLPPPQPQDQAEDVDAGP